MPAGIDRRSFVKGSTFLLAGGGLATIPVEALANTQGSVLRVLVDQAPNTLDPAGLGYNRMAMQLSLCVYDRLLGFGTKTLENGSVVNDYSVLAPELAEKWTTPSASDPSVTITLRRDAIFHDGSPVTAHDVKWSLDRGVSVPVGKGQMATGSMTETEQFVVVDDHTIKIRLDRPDRRTLPNLAFPFFPIFNSRVAKRNATAEDPWATEWLKRNVAGGGAYQLESWVPGENVALKRHDKWRSGPMPYFARIVEQVVPTASNRRAALANGDCDVALSLPPRDILELEQGGKVKVISTPLTNNLTFIAMNTKIKPFDDARVRKAVAYALPYEAMFKTAQQSRGVPLWGASEGRPLPAEFPTQSPYRTDPDRAKKLLQEAGHSSGFETTFSIDLGNADVAEPISILVQEALGKIGISAKINKMPTGQFGSALGKHELPFFLEASVSWIADPDYYMEIFYQRPWRFNYGNFQDPKIERALAATRWETDPAKYDAAVREMVAVAFDEIPIIPLWLSSFDMTMGKDIGGFVYYYHRRVDYRGLRRA